MIQKNLIQMENPVAPNGKGFYLGNPVHGMGVLYLEAIAWGDGDGGPIPPLFGRSDAQFIRRNVRQEKDDQTGGGNECQTPCATPG